MPMEIQLHSVCLYPDGTVEIVNRITWEWLAHRCAKWEAAMCQPAIVATLGEVWR
jgi:hypothetical protein